MKSNVVQLLQSCIAEESMFAMNKQLTFEIKEYATQFGTNSVTYFGLNHICFLKKSWLRCISICFYPYHISKTLTNWFPSSVTQLHASSVPADSQILSEL